MHSMIEWSHQFSLNGCGQFKFGYDAKNKAVCSCTKIPTMQNSDNKRRGKQRRCVASRVPSQDAPCAATHGCACDACRGGACFHAM
jgi:hypothetical protein